MSTQTNTAGDLPVARLDRERRLSAAWLVPLLAVLVTAWLGYRAWQERGVGIVVTLDEAHGLESGDPVRYRGTAIGEVRGLRLTPDAAGVIAQVRLNSSARTLARDGTRFWVVHPQLGLAGVSGLETIVGPRYLALAPGPTGAAARRRFLALPAPPPVVERDPGDLEIILEAAKRGGLRPGTPIAYRGIAIGRVLTVGLASDGGHVEARVHVEAAFRGLVRSGSRFWETSGLRAEIGLGGVTIETGSLPELVVGGLAMATPPPEEAGEPVLTGHRFHLAAEADEAWLEWTPGVAVGSRLLPPGASLPHPRRAVLAWRQGLVIKRGKSRSGWVLLTPRGLLGPADLLTSEPGDRIEEGTVVLEVGGANVPLDPARLEAHGGLALLATDLEGTPWPDDRTRSIAGPLEPEDCLIVADPNGAPVPVSAARLSIDGGRWRMDGSVGVGAEHHGAPVLARADGRLLGLLLVEDGQASIAPAPLPAGEG